nr:immunoglobulin heavy chain junction region [Mus musculus]
CAKTFYYYGSSPHAMDYW